MKRILHGAKEYLEDYASEETKQVGYDLIRRELNNIPKEKVRALQHGKLGLLDLVVFPSGGGELIFRDLKGIAQKGVVLVQIIGLQITICIIFGRIHAKLPLSGG